MRTRFVVTCEDGLVRHPEPFDTRQMAEYFADWGHACTGHHRVERQQAVQMESRRAALPCGECRGTGTVTEQESTCNHGGTSCPCDIAALPCPRCEGSKVEPCTVCAEPSALIGHDGEDYCIDCAAEFEAAA